MVKCQIFSPFSNTPTPLPGRKLKTNFALKICFRNNFCGFWVQLELLLQFPNSPNCDFSLTFLHCVCSNVSPNCLHKRMQSHIGCICLAFLHCAFSNASSKRLHKRKQSHIGCICLTFLHCAFSNVSSNRLPEKMYRTQSQVMQKVCPGASSKI